MSEHTVKSYEGELEALSTQVAQMGGVAENLLQGAIDAVARRDSALADRMIESDRRIDDYERQIEAMAVKLLALRQPVGIDLRLTITSLRIANELERIGDLAKNIAKRALVLNREQPVRLTQGLVRMGRECLVQLKRVLDALAARDANAAAAVWRSDEEIDELYNSLFRELLTYMMEDPRTISLATHLLFIAKNLERVGDHATNIAEQVTYLVRGAYLGEDRPKGDATSTTAVPFEQPS
ncbi:MAG: phosphate signaling complex protein PhoU [Alphaproteobacteria bacterium]|nr:phosphate signaling complex protein PhoU [Alphaproteobacteria bacterium]